MGINIVYRFLNDEGEILYVGKTRQEIRKRIEGHFGSSGHLMEHQLSKVNKIEYLVLRSQLEMDIVELYYINRWKPPYNTQSKYDEEFVLDERKNDVWHELVITEKNQGQQVPPKLRVEVVLTENDSDLIEYLDRSDTPRATQFKNALRAEIKGKKNEDFEERTRRLLREVLEIQEPYPTYDIDEMESKVDEVVIQLRKLADALTTVVRDAQVSP